VITRYTHSTRFAQQVLIAILACALAGCGEEVHYTPPPAGAIAKPSTAKPSTPTPLPTSDNTAGDFADDVATELAGETASAVGQTAVGQTASTPTPEPPAPAPATPPPPAPDPARSPRRMAWLLGSNLSLAALANDRAAAPDKVADWFDKSQRLAKLVGTTVTELPQRPAADQADPHSEKAMEYLFNQGQAIGRHLATQYGDDHAALFELAVKSNILLVLYQPGAPAAKSLSASIRQAGERAEVPPELLQPLLKLIDEGAPAKDVRNAVFQLHDDVDGYLRTASP
jgi:hypothetical protein